MYVVAVALVRIRGPVSCPSHCCYVGALPLPPSDTGMSTDRCVSWANDVSGCAHCGVWCCFRVASEGGAAFNAPPTRKRLSKETITQTNNIHTGGGGALLVEGCGIEKGGDIIVCYGIRVRGS